MKRIGFIGGSFDPIHTGHVSLFKEALERLELDHLYIVPTKNNPWKEKNFASDNQRVKMIEIACQNLEDVDVSTIELDSLDEVSYTYLTINKLKSIYPHDQLFYIIGMDQASKFDQWYHCQDIARHVQLVAFQRKGYQKNENIEKYHFLLLDNDFYPGSSTEVREGHLEYLDHHVLSYISSQGIYLDTMIRPYMSKKRYQHTLSVASLAKELAISNQLDGTIAYIAGLLHDVAKEMDHEEALSIMKKEYSQYIDKPEAIWHQWLSSYVAKNTFLVNDQDVLQAIENHTTGSLNMSKIDKCVYCADKYEPLRGFDATYAISLCHQDIDNGFAYALKDFYDFSKKKQRDIDDVFYEIYKKYAKGDLNE